MLLLVHSSPTSSGLRCPWVSIFSMFAAAVAVAVAVFAVAVFENAEGSFAGSVTHRRIVLRTLRDALPNEKKRDGDDNRRSRR